MKAQKVIESRWLQVAAHYMQNTCVFGSPNSRNNDAVLYSIFDSMLFRIPYTAAFLLNIEAIYELTLHYNTIQYIFTILGISPPSILRVKRLCKNVRRTQKLLDVYPICGGGES
jgi:hypothetical protein